MHLPGISKTSLKSFDKWRQKYSLFPAPDGVVAQLVEHHNGIVGVAGSIPVGSTILQRALVLGLVNSQASPVTSGWCILCSV